MPNILVRLLRTHYNEKEHSMYQSAYREHQPVMKTFKLPSRTQQSFKDETNINNIMAKYQKTGLIDHVNEHGPSYGDQPSAGDYHEAMNRVASTKSMFEELPSSVREDFENDPALFLEYVSDQERREELLKTKKFNHEEAESGDEEPAKEPEKEADQAEENS